MILLVDNYDSFVWNLAQYLSEMGEEVRVIRNDRMDFDEISSWNIKAIVFSPGPRTPDEAGSCIPLIRKMAPTTPILGVCLGHQAIARVFNARVVRGPVPVHGKRTRIFHRSRGVFRGLPSPFFGARYHSLIVDRASIPPILDISSESDDGLVMGLSHRTLPTYGIQFHPESYVTEHGHRLLENFLELASAWNTDTRDLL